MDRWVDCFVNYAAFSFGIGLILFALEYKKTPTSAIAVPENKFRPQESRDFALKL